MVLIAHVMQMPWGLHPPHSFLPFSSNLGPHAFVVPFKCFLCCSLLSNTFWGVFLMSSILHCNLIFSGTKLWFPCILFDCAHVFQYVVFTYWYINVLSLHFYGKGLFNLAGSGFKAFKILSSKKGAVLWNQSWIWKSWIVSMNACS